MCPCLCRNGSTVTEQRGRSKPRCREVGPQLLCIWLLKLTSRPLSTVNSCLQETNPTRCDSVMKVVEIGD